VEKGDLVKISAKGGAISYEIGIFLGTKSGDNYFHWATFYINGKERNLFIFDYIFEVIK
tara:strand:+ start:156 stop:332 length:177 start_codon:yes stop_codon:yes gene_type:complete